MSREYSVGVPFTGIGGGFVSEDVVRSYSTSIGMHEAIAAASVKGMKVWTGSAWVEKPVKVWTGSAWVQKPVKRWNGSAWV